MKKKRSSPRNGLQNIVDELTEEEWLKMVEQLKRAEVPPKFNEWRKPHPYKIAYGGRGAGAKTESAFSLAVQFGESPQYFGGKVNIIVTRETENTIDLSSFVAVEKKINTLGYSGWKITNKYIENTKNGSRIAFRGLSDLTADNFRSVQDVDILICEEAHGIGYNAWNTVLPSIRKKNAEVWVMFNRVLEIDPCYDLFVLNERPNSCVLELQPGNIDNPWFDESSLPEKREADYKRDPDEAAHIWEGLPRKQGANSVMSRIDVLAAMERNIENPEGGECVGVDVARFGTDSTQIYRRKGLKITRAESLRGYDTIEVSDKAYEVGAKEIVYNVDGGYNPGVIDVLRGRGRDVKEISFGSTRVNNPDLYANVATEMWFEFPIKEADIPNDRELLIQLTDRRYTYDKKKRKIIESKDVYKKRNGGKSPDKADALIMAFYEKNGGFDEDIRAEMAALRARN